MSDQTKPLRVLVVGCGNMGASHAGAYHTLDGFEICGLVSTGNSKKVLNEKLGGGYALFQDYAVALEQNTATERHHMRQVGQRHALFDARGKIRCGAPVERGGARLGVRGIDRSGKRAIHAQLHK